MRERDRRAHAPALTPPPPRWLEAGLFYPISEVPQLLTGWGEKQPHEMAHSWIGGQLRFANNWDRAGDVEGAGDKWALEGFTHLAGILAVEPEQQIQFLQVCAFTPRTHQHASDHSGCVLCVTG